MTNPHCPSCLHFMFSHDLRAICRRNGLPATPTNADGCRQYLREPGADDEPMAWVDGAWRVLQEED